MTITELQKHLENDGASILLEVLIPLVPKLYDEWELKEVIIMVTSVTNATAYGIPVLSSEYHEAKEAYLDAQELDEETREYESEAIDANSRFFKDLA